MRPYVLLTDITACLVFLTRIPLAVAGLDAERKLARSAWAFGVVGVLVGGIGAVVYAIAWGFGLAPLVAATLAVAAMTAVTGALHEDGLADTVDGFGGGRDREAKLLIMRDSRLGAFGAVALMLTLVLKIATLAALAEPAVVASVLVAAATASRAAMVVVMAVLAPARADGLGASSGAPSVATAAAGVALAVIVAFAVVPAAVGLLVGVVAGGAAMAWLAHRQIGGHTGDVLGATQQVTEIAALVVAAAALS
jgi:adenosylcobinamide-GDP ribazoletransferase